MKVRKFVSDDLEDRKRAIEVFIQVNGFLNERTNVLVNDEVKVGIVVVPVAHFNHQVDALGRVVSHCDVQGRDTGGVLGKKEGHLDLLVELKLPHELFNNDRSQSYLVHD